MTVYIVLDTVGPVGVYTSKRKALAVQEELFREGIDEEILEMELNGERLWD